MITTEDSLFGGTEHNLKDDNLKKRKTDTWQSERKKTENKNSPGEKLKIKSENRRQTEDQNRVVRSLKCVKS